MKVLGVLMLAAGVMVLYWTFKGTAAGPIATGPHLSGTAWPAGPGGVPGSGPAGTFPTSGAKPKVYQ